MYEKRDQKQKPHTLGPRQVNCQTREAEQGEVPTSLHPAFPIIALGQFSEALRPHFGTVPCGFSVSLISESGRWGMALSSLIEAHMAKNSIDKSSK